MKLTIGPLDVLALRCWLEGREEEKKMDPCKMCEADTGKHPSGAVSRREKCGCDVAGYGLLPNPWHVHFCLIHAKAPDMYKFVQQVRALFFDTDLRGMDSGIWEEWREAARVLLLEITPQEAQRQAVKDSLRGMEGV